MSWTQPVCERCWFTEFPARRPVQFIGAEEIQHCCRCGEPTVAGIYVRRDPAAVPYPRIEKEHQE